MATHLSPVSWENPLGLDPRGPLHIFDKSGPNSSFLHSQKLTESRRAFLRNINNDEEAETQVEATHEGNRKTPAKKISFKIKKTSSVYRRNAAVTPKMATISASKVAELTLKFNKINESANSEQTSLRKHVKRVNSQRSLDSDKVTRKTSVRTTVTRKPSVKTKPNLDGKEIVIVKRKTVIKCAKSQESVRPSTLQLDVKTEKIEESSPTNGSVRATIEIFERRNSTPTNPTNSVPKPKVPEKPTKLIEKKTEEDIPLVTPHRRCDSMYETLNLKVSPPPTLKITKSEETIVKPTPNTSFLWSINKDKTPSPSKDDWKELYDFVDPKPQIPPRSSPSKQPPTPPKKTFKKQLPEEKIYEELNVNRDEDTVSHNYEYCDDGYEVCAAPELKENIYETLPVPPLLPKRQMSEPLPPRPPSRTSYCTIQNESVSNCYETIDNPESKSNVEIESTYESIYGCHIRGTGSNRDSLISSDQQSNSLYGRGSLVGWGDDATNPYSGKATSDLSTSDRSDEWVDMTDNEDNENNNSEIIIIRERQKPKKTGWSQQFREQWSKSSKKLPAEQSADDHLYESLYNRSKECHDDDYDSFDSESDSDSSFTKINSNDSGLDIGNNQLPEPPNNQAYVFTRLAATVKRKLRRNWSLTKNDISKSLSRMTKRKSRTELTRPDDDKHRKSSPEILVSEVPHNEQEPETKSLPRKSFLNKFRRSMSLSTESANELTANLDNKPKSTFYLTEEIDVDKNDSERDSGASLSPVQRNSKVLIRPHSPPPPAPVDKPRKDKRSTSWYAEVGLFKNSENNLPRRSNTFWYAEVGLYQTSKSTPSTSSAENSGNATNVKIKSDDFINQDNKEEYYNMRNETEYYNDSITSISSSETKRDFLKNLVPDNNLHLEDEPLYQFYDAAVLESVCQESTSDFDSDGYEEVSDNVSESRLSSRPSAMELVAPGKHSVSVSRTLWCEIPEVINSSVLSTLSLHQKKLQEAKFEMITSEASYLNSLNVLRNHFIKNIENSELLTREEFDTLFGQVEAVRISCEKLLYDLEKCWQDNILLHGVCDIVQKHAEENFYVYVPYCENQILFDETLKKLKERSSFLEFLRQIESNSTCHSLTLYSFLMLPMQRITRWPLLVDAVLKRLSQQDSEYSTCQYSLAVLNKIVTQCNEGARRKERENEMKKLVHQLEFSKGVTPVEVFSEDRWLIRSGAVTHMQQRTDEIKLTFGKRFAKSTLYLFLFNDMLFVTKPKSENYYTITHYCPRNLVELSSTDMVMSIPLKESQGRHLLFLTLLENQNEKTVEFLLSCSSESDKERWIEALTPPKSEDPDETLYECWDCPQVTALHSYPAGQPDELALTKGDTINVLRKMADGWYNGERLRDGQTGWFPANYTVEVANPHVRSRNLKQRYRLLAFSENYLKAK